jgi:hypothetical protein
MKRSLVTILVVAIGVMAGAVLAGATMIAIVLGLVDLYVRNNPPDGNDFQYLGLYLFWPLIDGVVVVVTLAGALLGGWFALVVGSKRNRSLSSRHLSVTE